jgi:hypothetical protein
MSAFQVGAPRGAAEAAPAFLPQPDWLRPLGPRPPMPRALRWLLPLAAVLAVASLFEAGRAWQQWRVAAEERAHWQAQANALRSTARPRPPNATAAVAPRSGSGAAVARLDAARAAAWAVQRELEHPWGAMGTALQAAPAATPSLRWLAMEHRAEVSPPTWRLLATVARSDDALATADALAAAGWASVRVQRIEPVAGGWRFEMQAQWPAAPAPAAPVARR